MIQSKNIKINNIEVSNDKPFTLIAGPCQMESRDHALMMAENLYNITEKLDIPFIYKSSFDKANRTSAQSFRGPGLEEGLRMLQKVKETFGLPLTTIAIVPHPTWYFSYKYFLT